MRLLLLFWGDLLALWIAHRAAVFLRYDVFRPFFDVVLIPSGLLFRPIWLPLVFMFFLWSSGLYLGRHPFWEEVKRLWKAVILATMASFAVVSLGKMSDYVSRAVLLLTSLLAWVTLPLFRFLVQGFLWLWRPLRRQAIILGAGETGRRLLKSLLEEKSFCYEVLGFLDDRLPVGSVVDGKQVLGSIADMDRFLRRNVEVMVALPTLPVHRLAGLVNKAQKRVRRVSFVPDFLDMPLFEGEMEFFVGTQTLLLTVRNNLKSPLNRLVKRLFDLVFVLMALPFLFPLCLLITLAVKLTSPGPVFYGQERVGFSGRRFRCWKFRTMYQDADSRLKKLLASDADLRREWERTFKLKNDPRVTPVGRFLRRTSLDELPQLLNILVGEMSLVGPRPVVAEELGKYYKNHDEFYLEVRPGLTGLWQISGRNDVDYDRRVRLDVWYVSNWSLWLDVIILLGTVRAVLQRRGAY